MSRLTHSNKLRSRRDASKTLSKKSNNKYDDSNSENDYTCENKPEIVYNSDDNNYNNYNNYKNNNNNNNNSTDNDETQYTDEMTDDVSMDGSSNNNNNNNNNNSNNNYNNNNDNYDSEETQSDGNTNGDRKNNYKENNRNGNNNYNNNNNDGSNYYNINKYKGGRRCNMRGIDVWKKNDIKNGEYIELLIFELFDECKFKYKNSIAMNNDKKEKIRIKRGGTVLIKPKFNKNIIIDGWISNINYGKNIYNDNDIYSNFETTELQQREKDQIRHSSIIITVSYKRMEENRIHIWCENISLTSKRLALINREQLMRFKLLQTKL